MKNVMRFQIAGCSLSALGLLFGAAGVQASSCGVPSALFDTLGDDYFTGLDDSLRDEPLEKLSGRQTDLTAMPGDRSDPRRSRAISLQILLDNLRNKEFHSGEGERTVCRGDDSVDNSTDKRRPRDSTRHEVTWQFRLEDIERVETLNGEMAITAWEDRHTVIAPARSRYAAGSTQAEVMDVPQPNEWVVHEDMNALTVNRRHRRAGSSGSLCRNSVFISHCTYLAEIDLTARAVGKSIELQQVFYINGRRSEWVTWRLDS